MKFLHLPQYQWLSVMLGCLLLAPMAFAGLPDWLELARQRPIPDTWQESDWVVLHHETCLSILKSGEFRLTKRWAIKILSVAGTDYGQYTIHYREGDKIENIQAFQINKAGETMKLDKKDFVESSIFKEADFSDERQILVTFDEPIIGDILAVEYRYQTTPLFYNFNFTFQSSDAPFLFSKLSVDLPRHWQFDFCMPIKPDLVKITQADNVTSWTTTNLPAIKERDFIPPLHLVVPAILLRFTSDQFVNKTIPTWKVFGNFVNRLWHTKTEADANITTKVQEITQNQADLLGKIKNICKFVQRQIRYISIQIEWGRISPLSAAQTLHNYYGDCKAKSALTISMLAQIGIEAYPVLAMTKEAGAVYPDFAASQFNHVIIAIPLTDTIKTFREIQGCHAMAENFLFFDPTAESIPLGELPWSIQDTWTFVIQPDTSFLIQLPQCPLEAMTEIHAIQAKLTTGGELDVAYQAISNGYLGIVTKAYWQEIESKKVKSVLLEHYLDDFAAPNLHDYQIRQRQAPDSAMVVKIDFSVPDYARKIQDLLAFKPNIMNAMSARILTQKTRNIPIYFGQPLCVIDTVIITLPPAYQIEEIPTAMHFQTEGIEYEMNCWSRQDTLWYVRYARRSLVQAEVTDYEKIQKFYENRYLADQQQVVVKFNPQSDADFVQLKQQVARQSSSADANTRLAEYYVKNNLYSEAIDCYMKLLKTTAKTAALHYNLGVCHYQLRQYAEALKWAQTAEKAGHRQASELIEKIERQILVR